MIKPIRLHDAVFLVIPVVLGLLIPTLWQAALAGFCACTAAMLAVLAWKVRSRTLIFHHGMICDERIHVDLKFYVFMTLALCTIPGTCAAVGAAQAMHLLRFAPFHTVLATVGGLVAGAVGFLAVAVAIGLNPPWRDYLLRVTSSPVRVDPPVARAVSQLDHAIDVLLDSPHPRSVANHTFQLTVLLVTRGHLLDAPVDLVDAARGTYAPAPEIESWHAIQEACRSYAEHVMAEQKVQSYYRH